MRYVISLSVLIAALAGCGGGGSSSGPPPAVPAASTAPPASSSSQGSVAVTPQNLDAAQETAMRDAASLALILGLDSATEARVRDAIEKACRDLEQEISSRPERQEPTDEESIEALIDQRQRALDAAVEAALPPAARAQFHDLANRTGGP